MEEEIDIKDLIIELWRKKWIIVIVTLVFAIIGLVKYGNFGKTNNSVLNKSNASKEYVAAMTFMLGKERRVTSVEEQVALNNGSTIPTTSSSTNEYKITVDDSLVATLNEIVKSKTVLESVINDLGLEKISAAELSKKVEINKVNTSDFLRILVKYTDKEKCTEIVTKIMEYALPKAYSIYNISSIIELDELHILDEDEITEIANEQASEPNTVITSGKVSTGSKKKMVLVTAIGFVLSCGVIVVLELFNNSIKNEEELEKSTKLKTLVKINSKKEDLTEDFKLLRVNIKECKTMLITSPEEKDGKTFVAENLSKSFARLNKKVVLVDLVKNNNDMIQKYNGKGLSNYLNSEDKFIEKYAVPTNVKNLSVLLAGDQIENMTENLESEKALETLETLSRLYDVVIIDSENILESSNTLAMAKISKYSILVSTERKTSLEKLIKAKNNIEDVGGTVIGNVLIKA